MLPFARLALGGYRGMATPLLSRPMLRPRFAPSVVRALSKAPNYPAAGTIAKLKWLVSEYGAVGVCTHFSIYFATLGGLFLGVDNGFFLAGDALSMLKSVGVDKLIDLDHLNPKASNFAVAWILAKFTEPLRLPVTLWLTPRVAGLVRRSGLR